MSNRTGGFTLPGEAGYEELTLDLAKKWGADVIRDSDGTELSAPIIEAGYGIYSTLCLIRNHNEWAKAHKEQRQQCFLITDPVLATSDTLAIEPMKDFFEEQFELNTSYEALSYWEVYDRTTGERLPSSQWEFDETHGRVLIHECRPFHRYTVSFMVYRIWEEISMYNHTTNHWDSDHLMQIDPMYEETQAYLVEWMKQWCEQHPTTTVVRFTSMFYNFVWIWGSDARNRHRFTDWGSYDFTVSVRGLKLFEEANGYAMHAEDFVNKGRYHVSHMPSDERKKDWMAFINDQVITFGKQLVDIAHGYGKKAYVFYDDSWVGIEPYNDRFQEFGFDGMIKCVFSGFEARLCAGVDVETHEIRLHPYLFPVGLGGAPTFMEGGNPTLDAKQYWMKIRRALLREPIERIGLGGYLHLVQDFPDFVEYMELIADEFREIKGFHDGGKPYTVKPTVGVLTTWGKLRSWTLSGHFHETNMHDLIHVNEALSGLPVNVCYIDFEDVRQGALDRIDVLINAGFEGSAWSGGNQWANVEVVDRITKWAYEGGVLIGINQPSALRHGDTFYQLSHILGVDEDLGDRVSHGHWQYEIEDFRGITLDSEGVLARKSVFLTEPTTKVHQSMDDNIAFTTHIFGKGMGIYLGGFRESLQSTRFLFDLIRHAAGVGEDCRYITDNMNTECAYYPEAKMLVAINNSQQPQKTVIKTDGDEIAFELAAFETQMRPI